MTDSNIVIRPMTKTDLKASAAIMAHAFRAKLVLLKSWTDKKIIDLILDVHLFDSSNFEGHYVATCQNEVVGILHLNWFEQQKNRKNPQLDILRLFRKFGIWRILITGLALPILDSKVEKDEMMVDHIAVHPDYRGQGIGAALLSFGEEQAKNHHHVIKYTLMVIGRNERAKRLYERMGFKINKICDHTISKVLTSVKKSQYMVKDLS